MRLRVSITIDLEAADYVEAAAHQRRLEGLFEGVAAEYPTAEFQFRERRVRAARRSEEREAEGVTQLKHYTGRLNRYA